MSDRTGSRPPPRPEDRTVVSPTKPRRVETQEPVHRLLEQRRSRTGANRRLLGGTGAALLHVGVIAAALFGPRLFAKPKQVEYVPVQLVPAPVRGVERPARRRRPEPVATPAPLPAEPEPTAAPASTPEPEPTQPIREPPEPPEPEPSQTPPPGPPGPPGRQGAPTGRPDSPFTATVGGVDNPTFTYGYYLDRMLLLIRAQWVRPPLGSGVEATVHFRILRDGTVEAIELVDSSGYNSFDLAALRALQAAAPLPPLPRSYREGQLGVNLIFR